MTRRPTKRLSPPCSAAWRCRPRRSRWCSRAPAYRHRPTIAAVSADAFDPLFGALRGNYHRSLADGSNAGMGGSAAIQAKF